MVITGSIYCPGSPLNCSTKSPGIGEWLVALSPKGTRPKNTIFGSPNKLDNQKLKMVSLEGRVKM